MGKVIKTVAYKTSNSTCGKHAGLLRRAKRKTRQGLRKTLGAGCDRDSTVRVARRVYETLSRMRRVERELAGSFGREPSFEEVAREMHISADKLHEYIALGEREEVLSLQALLAEEDAEDRLDFVS